MKFWFAMWLATFIWAIVATTASITYCPATTPTPIRKLSPAVHIKDQSRLCRAYPNGMLWCVE